MKNNYNVLTISTSFRITYVGIVEISLNSKKDPITCVKTLNGELFIHKSPRFINQKSRKVAESIDKLYAKAIGNQPYDLVVVDKGPGSFTGIRTGVAFAKGLTINRDMPVRSVSILDALGLQKYIVENVSHPKVQIDARHGNCFVNQLNFPDDLDPESPSRNKINFQSCDTPSEVDEITIIYLALLGLNDYLVDESEQASQLSPIYGREVNITKPKK